METEKAFEEFCRVPLINEAISRASNQLPLAVIRVAFMEGAKYATNRCRAAGHTVDDTDDNGEERCSPKMN